MALTTGLKIAKAIGAAWGLLDVFPNRTQLINHLVGEGLGFNRAKMFKVIGNIWERGHAPEIDLAKYRFDVVPKELMAELDWTREERFGIKGTAIYRDKFGNLERHDTVFWTDNMGSGLEYEEMWEENELRNSRYPHLQLLEFNLDQVWHKKGADYGHPMLQEI